MKFDSPLSLIDAGTNRCGRQVYRLTEPLIFGGFSSVTRARYALTVRVPIGFETDFASIPRILWWLFPPAGPWSPAAAVHDFLCESHACSRFMADAIFRDAMLALGVPWWRRVMMYYAVRAYSICWGLR